MASDSPTASTAPSSPSDKLKAKKFGGLVKKHNALVDVVFAFQPLAGSGLVRNDSTDGRLLSVSLPIRSGKGGSKRFSFQLSDASDADGLKINILDGEVFGPNDVAHHDGHVPQGMGNDDYDLPVDSADGEIWLIIPFTPGTFTIIDPITIDQGMTMPDDVDDKNSKLEYIRLGTYTVKQDPITSTFSIDSITNTQCGDYFVVDNSGPSDHYSFQIVDASDEAGYPAVLIYDGLINDELPDGMGDDDFILPAEDGMTLYAGIAYDTDTLEITSRYVASVPSGSNPPDDQFGFFTVILGGCAVTYSGANASVAPYNAHCGDIKFTLDFGALNGKAAFKPSAVYTDWTEFPTK